MSAVKINVNVRLNDALAAALPAPFKKYIEVKLANLKFGSKMVTSTLALFQATTPSLTAECEIKGNTHIYTVSGDSAVALLFLKYLQELDTERLAAEIAKLKVTKSSDEGSA